MLLYSKVLSFNFFLYVPRKKSHLLCISNNVGDHLCTIFYNYFYTLFSSLKIEP